MAYSKSAGTLVDGLNASGDYWDWEVTYNLQPGGIVGFGPVPTGLPLVRKLTSLTAVGTQNSVPTIPTNPGPANTFPIGAADQVQLATDAAPGDVFGAFQGPFTGPLVAAQLQGGVQSQGPIVSPLTASAQIVRLVTRKVGVGWVLCGVNAGATAFARGNAATVGTTFVFAVEAAASARAIGTSLGLVMEYPINTTVLSAVSAGTNVTIPMSSPSPIATGVVGMTTAIPITIGSGATQETVTPSTVTQGVFASQTITIGGGNTTGTCTITIGGGSSIFPAVTVPFTCATSVTQSALNLVAALNASAAALGLAPFIQASQNAAGVVTVCANALTPAAAYNAIPISASAVTGGNFTVTVGGATLAGGVNPSVVATIANAHAAGEPVQGINNGSASIIVAPSVGYLAAALPVDLNVLA